MLSDLPAGYCAPESQGVAAVVGQILVAVQPATDARFDEVLQIVAKARAQWTHFGAAGVIESRDACDAQQNVRDLAVAQAQDSAQILSRASGLEVQSRRSLGIAFSDVYSPERYQVVCGDDPMPALSPKAGDFLSPAPPYLLSVSGQAAFTAGPGAGIPSNPSHALVLQTAGKLNFTQGIVPYAIQVPPDEPFVSAQGTFRALVRPDALLLSFSVPDIPARTPPPDLMNNIVNAVRSAGVAPADIRRHRTYVSVRIRPVEQALVSRVQLRVKAVESDVKDYPTGYGFTAFVQDCDALKFAVAREAFLSGLKRARVLASTANLGLGDIIGLNDAGQDTDAFCGYGARSTTDELDARAALPGPLNLYGPYAVFESSVVIAWHLKGGVPTVAGFVEPHFASLDTTNVNQAFEAPRFGNLGYASVALNPTRAFITVANLQRQSPLLRSLTVNAAVQTDRESNELFELREPAPQKVLSAVRRLKSAGLAVQKVAFHAGDCERRSLQALKESVMNGLSLIRKQPIYALIDQLPVYYAEAGPDSSGSDNNSICSFPGVDSFGNVGGSYEGYGNLEYSLQQQVLVVPGASPRPAH